MKKTLTVFLIFILSFSRCTGNKDNLNKITLNEVAHSVFYAPQYVAIEMGYFKEEGIDLQLVTGFGADKVMTAVLSGECDIGFMGSESSVYVYNEGAKDYAVNIGRLTNRAGNFLISRMEESDFSFEDLKGKTVLGGRTGGMPEMILEYVLHKHGIDPENDLSINKSIDFGLTAEAFISGEGDYTMEFEPSATLLVNEGYGHIVASLGVESGYVPYTAYCVKKSYLEENEDVLYAFLRAMQKGLDYVNTHTPEEIATVIQPQFAETDYETLTTIVNRYYEQESWNENLIFTEESFNLLQDILISAGELEDYVPFDSLVENKFALEAFEK